MTQPVSIRYYYMVTYAFNEGPNYKQGRAFLDDAVPLNTAERVEFTENNIMRSKPGATDLILTSIHLLRTERAVE